MDCGQSVPPAHPRSFREPKRQAPRGSEDWARPWVRLKYFTWHPCVYGRMIGEASEDARPGDLVQVRDKNGQIFGLGLYNPQARVPLRVIHHGADKALDELVFLELLERAIVLRERTLGEAIAACRLVNSDGDGLSGLVIDRYEDVLSVEATSLGIYQRLPTWLPWLHQRLGTKRQHVHVDPEIARMEGIKATPTEAPKPVRIREQGVRYEVRFDTGQKTGFFCDQRDNRRRLGEWVKSGRVLDLCCYTGGFALAAKILGGAEEVTAVDWDEKALAQAKVNANLNQTRIHWVHADAFVYARQMEKNGETFETVVLDPPKFLLSREDELFGRRKYMDLNALGLRLVSDGGLFVTCSCSGLLSAQEFEGLVVSTAHKENIRLQILERTGAGPDHPVMSNCPESRYLKVLWARVFRLKGTSSTDEVLDSTQLTS